MDSPTDRRPPPPDNSGQAPRRNISPWWLLVIIGAVFAVVYYSSRQSDSSTITYLMFRQQLKAGNIAKIKVDGDTVRGEFKNEPPINPRAGKDPEGKPIRFTKEFTTALPSPKQVERDLDDEMLAAMSDGGEYSVVPETDGSTMILIVYLLVTVGLFAGIFFLFRQARNQVMGGGMMAGFSRSPAKRYQTGEKPITFNDVAGLDGVKNELEEIVEFLKNPEKFQRLGGRAPKGVLLVGPPGTGKTLLGRAIAGEADVPFFSISGSEFIQLYVGVGASRVRDMFATAKEHSPSILFIDEIDAVGRHRGTGMGGGNDEREQTLNQILSEMDGFLQTESVIVIAATNRPDVLDPALLRPGRFDRHVTVDRPNLKGRLAIFEVHTREVPLAGDVDLRSLAAGSVGLTGADIQSLVNEAALWASRHDKEKVEQEDFDYARDKVLMGVKREEVLSGKEKAMTAYHESGHALLAWLIPSGDRLHKVSIIPRGRSLGATQLLPEEDRVNIAESELHTRLLFLLGGRSAEKLAFNEFTAGAEDDLKKATHLARNMVAHWGMSERLGPVTFRTDEDHPFLGKEMAGPRQFSEHTAQIIDEEVVRILGDASEKARKILGQHRDKLNKLAEALQREETLEGSDIKKLIGPPAYEQKKER